MASLGCSHTFPAGRPLFLLPHRLLLQLWHPLINGPASVTLLADLVPGAEFLRGGEIVHQPRHQVASLPAGGLPISQRPYQYTSQLWAGAIGEVHGHQACS